MALTGYLIKIYQDINPLSPTYNQTRTERELDDQHCQSSAEANWQITNAYCELNGRGMQTGYRVTEYTDIEPLSDTYNQKVIERIRNNTLCPPDSTFPFWVNIGESYCSQMVYMPGGRMANDGYKIQQQQDINEYSATYNNIREISTLDLQHCPRPSTEPVWDIISESCHTVVGPDGSLQFDGTKDVIRVDTNVYSSAYNNGVPETVNIEDSENCPVTSANWINSQRYCELSTSNMNTGNLVTVQLDANPDSPTYNQPRYNITYDVTHCPVNQSGDPNIIVRWKIINNTDTEINVIGNTLNNGLQFAAYNIAANGGFAEGELEMNESQYQSANITISDTDMSPTRTFTKVVTPNPYVWNGNGNRGITQLVEEINPQ